MVPRPAGYLLIFCTAAARNGLEYLDLFAIRFYEAAYVDDAAHAGTGAQALEAGVVRLYSVVVILSGWVRVGCARLFAVHSASPFLWAGLRGVPAPAGPFPLSYAR